MKEHLLGVWRGRGVASYPTIEMATYRERLSFVDHPEAPRIHYEQKTWRILPGGGESLLHWETGFLSQMPDGDLLWINAQNNGRVEVMKGHIAFENGLFLMEVRSTAFANDARMVESSRRVEVRGGNLRYVQMIATTTTETPLLQVHLEAELSRTE